MVGRLLLTPHFSRSLSTYSHTPHLSLLALFLLHSLSSFSSRSLPPPTHFSFAPTHSLRTCSACPFATPSGSSILSEQQACYSRPHIVCTSTQSLRAFLLTHSDTFRAYKRLPQPHARMRNPRLQTNAPYFSLTPPHLTHVDLTFGQCSTSCVARLWGSLLRLWLAA